MYRSQGRNEEALVQFGKALEIDIKVHGDMHPSVADTCKNMRLVHQKKGEWDKAEEYGEQEWNINKAVFGEDHAKAQESLRRLNIARNNLQQ